MNANRTPQRISALYRVLFVSMLGIATMLIGYELPGQTPDRAFQLADSKMQVSKLEWVMLTARIRVMEQILAHESSRSATLVGLHYDSDRKLVVAKSFVSPQWLDRAKIDEVKKVLMDQSLSYCVDGLGMAEAEAGEALAATSMGKNCAVEFFTWTVDKTGKLAPKNVATEEGGQLILK